MIDSVNIRNKFPFLNENYRKNKPLIYFDSAASAQKPQEVIDALSQFYIHKYANIHRGVYERAAQATKAYEDARSAVAKFINAKPSEIIFTRGTTEGLNLLASVSNNTLKGNKVLISEMEHHSNLVPWQNLCKQSELQLKYFPLLKDGTLDLRALDELNDIALISIGHISNSIGTVNPIETIIQDTQSRNCKVILDAAQSIAQIPINVKDLGIDAMVFSGHKIYGPNGIGVLYVKEDWLNELSPYQFGGDMIESVGMEKASFKQGPAKFEAGTPNIAGAIGLHKAIQFLESIGLAHIQAHQIKLTQYAKDLLKSIDGVEIVGENIYQQSIISFLYKEVHPHDIASIFDSEGIAIRAGHHCTEPVMEKWKLPGTARISFGIYNTMEEVNQLKEAFVKLDEIFYN